MEDILMRQTQKLRNLEIATELIKHKYAFREELLEASEESRAASQALDEIKEDVKVIKSNQNECKKLHNLFQILDREIQHLSVNIPPTIQEYVKSELKKKPEPSSDVKENLDCNTKDSNMNNQKSDAGKNCKKTLFNEPTVFQISELTEKEFQKIPKYIIGRTSLDTINAFVSSINQIIKAKYSLINSGKQGARKKGELDMYLHYKKQQITLGPEESKTQFFIAEDYERYIKTKLDKTKLNHITALRHCKRIREIRTAKTVHYAVIQ